MAGINMKNFFNSEEEYKKWLEETNKNLSTYSNWRSPLVSHGWTSDLIQDEEILPFEQDEHGVYGYKCLLRVPDKRWMVSPNIALYNDAIWTGGALTSDRIPKGNNSSGIYGTKNLDSLKEWAEEYRGLGSVWSHPFPNHIVMVVKIKIWGVVVEHSKGFRAEHAKIVEVLREYR